MARNNKIIGASFFLFGLISLFKVIGLFDISHYIITGCTLALYGFLSVIFNLGTSKKGLLFLGSTLFLIGLLFVFSELYQIIQKENLFLTLFLFVLGSGFFILFVDNPKERQFLILSGMFFVSATFTDAFVDALGSFSLLANFGIILLGYWPVFLVLMGLAILVSRKR